MPDRVAEVHVDLTEVVEVDVAHDDLAAVAPATGERLGQAVEQQELVGQTGVGVRHGQLPQLVVLPRPRGAAGLASPAELNSCNIDSTLLGLRPFARRQPIAPSPADAGVVRCPGTRVPVVPAEELSSSLSSRSAPLHRV